MPTTLLGAPNTRANFPSLLERGVREVFTLQYEIYDTGILEEVYTVLPSVKKQETDVVTSFLGLAPTKAEGDNVIYDSMQEVWTNGVSHVTYALAVEFTEESIEDNLYLDLIEKGGQSLARTMAYTRQVNAWDFWNNLSQTVYTVGSTGYALLATNHFMINGSTWANKPTKAVGLSQEALEERLQAWTINMVDQRGLKLDTQPEILMVGASDRMLAERILSSAYRSQSADNDVNPVKALSNLRVVFNPHLTDDGRWFLIAPKRATALRFFDRIEASVKKWDSGDTGNLKVRARMRQSHMAAHVTGISGSPGS